MAKKKPKAKAKRKAKPKPKAVPRRFGRKRKRSEAELQQQEDRQVAPALLDGPAEPAVEAGAVEPEPGPVEPRNDPGDMDDDMTLEELRQQAVGHAAPENAAPDSVVAEAPPRPACAPRAGPFQEAVQWTVISCPHCNTICGQIKLVPNPGTRDEPTWSMRVRQDGEWPSKGRFFKRRLARLINDDPDDGNNPEGARTWVMQMKTCCDAGRG